MNQETKVCFYCSQSKSVSEFALMRGKPRRICKECNRGIVNKKFKERYCNDLAYRKKLNKERKQRRQQSAKPKHCEDCGIVMVYGDRRQKRCSKCATSRQKQLGKLWLQTESGKQSAKKRNAKMIGQITDAYIVAILRQIHPNVKKNDIPNELIELKRAQILIKRQTKSQKHGRAKTKRSDGDQL